MNILTVEELESIRLLNPEHHAHYLYSVSQVEMLADNARLKIQETLSAAKNILIESGQVVPTE